MPANIISMFQGFLILVSQHLLMLLIAEMNEIAQKIINILGILKWNVRAVCQFVIGFASCLFMIENLFCLLIIVHLNDYPVTWTDIDKTRRIPSA